MLVFYGLIFGLGVYANRLRKERTAEDVLLAGRGLPLWLAVFTMSATWVGGGFINGTAESTYAFGLVWAQAPWGYGLSLILGGLIFARPMRRLRFKTLLDPLVQKYGQSMGSVLFIPAVLGDIFWSAAILTALGTTFGTVLGLDGTTSIIISAIIAIGYTVIGGLWAVAITDVVQLGLLMLGLAMVIPFMLPEGTGLAELWANYQLEMGELAQLFPDWGAWNDPAWGDSYWNWWDYALLLIFGGIPWQVYFQRVLAARTDRAAVLLSIFAGVVCMLAAFPAVLIGMLGATTDWAAIGVGEPENAAMILPWTLRYLSPPILATIGLGAVAAAVMSSVDSSILSASSLAVWNVYRPLFKPKITPTQIQKVLRRSIVLIGLSASILALQVQSVYVLWFLCSDLVYVLLFPAFVCALFDPKANRYGALAGFSIALLLRLGGGEAALGIPAFFPYPMIGADGICLFPFRTVAMLSGLMSILVVSRLTQGLDEGKTLVREEDAVYP